MDAERMAESDIMLSSMDEELITDIKRPSLISITSEDSHAGSDEERNIPSDYGPINYNIVGSTPIKESIEEYDFKMPAFPSLRDGKRFSLTPQDNPPSCVYSINKSNSLHDVSSIVSFSPLRRDSSSCMYSTETLQSTSIATTKSKDSGFQRSTSCSSLTTNASKKYDHVQSKVKQYIHTIKQTEALRKMQKRLERQSLESMETLSSPEASPTTETLPVSKKDLLNKVKELEEEIKEKDCVIEQLEKNHSELRLKYAAAETRIDDLRIRVCQNEDPITSYISDEKVAELLSGSVKNPNHVTKSITNPSIKKEPEFTSYEAAFARPFNVRQLQPIKKFNSSSIRLNETYPVLKSSIPKSSSCKYVKESNYELSKSASSLDKACAGFAENDVLNYSRAKVQQWQRSLVNLNHPNEDHGMEVCYGSVPSASPANLACYENIHRSRCCIHDQDADSIIVPADKEKCAMGNSNSTNRRYLKNKDADKKCYRKSYPVGCKCEKYIKKVKEEKKTVLRAPKKKLFRSVSFANSYDNESITSSMYEEEEDSSSDSSTALPVFVSKHESYKDYKQRKLLEKYERRKTPPKWNEIKKAKSATSLHRDQKPSRNKRLIENVSTSYEHSCAERKHCGSKSHKNKYRKLDDCSKVAATGCGSSQLMRCRSSTGYGVYPEESQASLQHSKSFDVCGQRTYDEDTEASNHRYNKLECSCLTALEKLKIQEHNTLAKFAEHMKKHSRSKPQDNSVQLAAYKRYSLNK
ncbi:uncharacterized protein LOC135842537 [Planococcus citri]|uniref:uncharacterized protein LOC135842537 n=1 Tax=Planococcus citri TaxID=170843 RepID=UPI0031F93A25